MGLKTTQMGDCWFLKVQVYEGKKGKIDVLKDAGVTCQKHKCERTVLPKERLATV